MWLILCKNFFITGVLAQNVNSTLIMLFSKVTRGNMLEQNEFKQCLLGFDDSKVLKVQLDMLIFVQV